MSGATKLMTAGGGGVSLTPASSIASDVTVNVPSQNCTLGIQGPAFSAYPSAGTSLANSTWTKVLFDTEEFDTNNNYSSSRFTPTIAGYYQINSLIGINVAASNTQIAIYKNGNQFKNGAIMTYSGTPWVNISSLVYANGSTDYFEIYVYQNAAGQTNYGGSILTYFQGVLVRAA